MIIVFELGYVLCFYYWRLLPPAHGWYSAFGCMSVCPVQRLCSYFWKPLPRNFVWYACTSSEYLGQVRISRSLGEGQGHMRKKVIRA